MTVVHTIGYKEMTFPELSHLSDQHGVAVLLDVRSKTNRVKHGYHPRDLEAARGSGRYRHDKRLGGLYDGPNPAPGRDGGRQRHPQWREAIDELVAQAAQMPVAIMCVEDDPEECHRGMWIQAELEERGVEVIHIRREGGKGPLHVDVPERGSNPKAAARVHFIAGAGDQLPVCRRTVTPSLYKYILTRSPGEVTCPRCIRRLQLESSRAP